MFRLRYSIQRLYQRHSTSRNLPNRRKILGVVAFTGGFNVDDWHFTTADKLREAFDHSKLMIVHGAGVLLGSTNWNTGSLRFNFELNLETYDHALAQELEHLANAKRTRTVELAFERVNTRPFLIKLRDGTARLLAPYL